MNIRSKLFGLLNKTANQFGYRIVKQSGYNKLASSSALARVLGRNLAINSVIDVGASNGMWSKVAREFLPDAHYLLIDANPIHEEALKAYVATEKNTAYALVAAGAQDSKIYFNAEDPFGGVASYTQEEHYVELPMRSVDSLVQEHKLKAPYLLKLDTHGFEVPIFEGAEETLKQTNLIFVEVYNFRIQDESLLFHEMCAFLADKGFRMIDLCDPLFRERDGALWQMDFLFIRDNRPEFDSNNYE